MSSAIDDHIAEVRGGITLLDPFEAAEVIERGGVLVDIRPAAQRRRFGEFRDAIVIERNVLEWRLDPTSDARLDLITEPDLPIVIACQEGFASSLAVASLGRIGLTAVSDLAGGFVAWQDAGLPTVAPWPRDLPDGAGDSTVERRHEVVHA